MTTPVAPSTAVDPLPGPRVTATEAGSRLPSTSESFASTSTATAASRVVVAASSSAAGGSFTAVTVTVTTAVSHNPPVSHTW